jgi:hypothetical protein
MFLASFFGCLFALLFVAIGAWGIFKMKMRRFVAQNAVEIGHRVKQEMSPEELREMETFTRQFLPREPQAPSEGEAP